MKNTLIKVLLFSIISFVGFNYIGNTYAENKGVEGSGVTVIVTEDIPGAGCEKIDSRGKSGLAKKGETQMYKCTVKGGFGSIIDMMGKIIKYFTFLASLGAVLFIIINGIMYSMGGADPSMKDDAKKRIVGTLSGLVLLLLSGVILNLIAPWIYK